MNLCSSLRKLAHLSAALMLGVVLAGTTACQTIPSEQRTAALKKWDKELAAFAGEDAKAMPAPGGTLFVGSSSFRMWRNVAEAFPERRVINRGFGGSQMHELAALVDELVWPYAPAEVLIYEGDNDIAAGKTSQQFMTEFTGFVRAVHRQLPDAKVFFVAIKPSPRRENLMPQATEANRLVEDYCAGRPWLDYIDVVTPMLAADGRVRGDLFIEDRLHMNAAGYEIWGKVIGQRLRARDGL